MSESAGTYDWPNPAVNAPRPVRDFAAELREDIRSGERDRERLIHSRDRALMELANADYLVECLDRRLARWREDLERWVTAPTGSPALAAAAGERTGG